MTSTGLYVLANAGAYLAFVPLLQILVPLQAALIDPAHAPVLLSRVAVCGALAASVANILFGALSDRTRSRTGGRRPWLAGGLGATLLTYAAIWRAGSPLALLAGVVAFQFAFNALFAPLGAVLADDVPDTRKGVVAALLGLGYPLASIVGAQVVGAQAVTGGARFAAIGLLVAASILPFILRPERLAPRPTPRRLALSFNPLVHTAFARALAGRFLVVTALSLVELYLLLYLRHLGARAGLLPLGLAPAFARLVGIMTLASVAAGLAAGYASDKWRRRSLFVFVGAACVACGIAGMAMPDSWRSLQLAALVYGVGAGIHYAVDLALIVQLLPLLGDAGKDLGFVNLANTVPQVAAPLLAMLLLGGDLPQFRLLFLIAAAAALGGGACVLGITPATPDVPPAA